ncbi:MAG: CPBP family intramembrane metalloprotease [Paracoccaceae bacterium]|nr:CPBP family intramembrane metalloprotease [Paracoccaceae bacterium]
MNTPKPATKGPDAAQPKPLTFLPALALFLGLGIWMRVCIYNVIPFLVDQGMHQFSAYLAGFILGLLPFLPLTFVFLKQEGHTFGSASLAQRLGFRRFKARHFALMIGLTVLAYAATLLASPTQTWITGLSPWLQPGEVFHPLQIPGSATDELIDGSAQWMGPDAAGYWPWAVAIVVLFILNIVGEELLWRGAIWPRQEQLYGKRTWLVHGFMWYLFHLPFYPWFLISGLPQALILSYLFQKTKNMWLVIIMHAIFNSVFYVILLMIVFGIAD